ncbi:MAG: ribonuclease III [Ruminococcaceae bacterium]|nr:ribonuclease III [Oscillospiraceae bacterium]
MENPKLLSPSTLAFVGDAVYGVLVRAKLAEVERPVGELHKRSVEYVNANAQSSAFELIKDCLTEEEAGIYKRGRNNHVGQIPKNATSGVYHSATGVEALFGFLYLKGETERLNMLFDIIWKGIKD